MIAPYKRNPEPPYVALLTPEGDVISEHGELLDFKAWPDGYRAWCDYDTVRILVSEGKGEALCWNGEEITWRHKKRMDLQGWTRRATDVHVIKLPFYEEHEATLRALAAWRDWLAGYGASPTSTTGSAAWSLLRATLRHNLWTSMGEAPPLKQTLGGRQELGPAGKGIFEGAITQIDLPAAYASELGNLRYGGHWHKTSALPLRRSADWWAQGNRPTFCRAFIRVPELAYGPLPRRPRKRVYGLAAALLGAEYPTGTRLQGVWTWDELRAAESHGATIIRVLDTWVHLAGTQQPFLPWWDAVQEGRQMRGLAGLLAKTTGNALWGRFAMDTKANGRRTIRSTNKRGKLVARPFTFQGGKPPSHDLAETVSGRVRARLFDAMVNAGDNLISAHTDGMWITADQHLIASLPMWRRKQEAHRIELLDPQVLRYYPSKGKPQTVFAGVPSKQSEAAFDEQWARTFPEAA